ncbi:MAG TPA: pinensin family lanthipeptide [Longimicrobium sp.]|nr:pinensin family lanthipeptide [Longimicrobium sp.]
MDKIRLELDSLKVQSFVTSQAEKVRGTVNGAQSVEVGPEPQSQPPRCWVESGDCLGTRFDEICDTSFCHTRECPIDTADCPLDTADCLTVPPGC